MRASRGRNLRRAAPPQAGLFEPDGFADFEMMIRDVLLPDDGTENVLQVDRYERTVPAPGAVRRLVSADVGGGSENSVYAAIDCAGGTPGSTPSSVLPESFLYNFALKIASFRAVVRMPMREIVR